MTFFPGYLDPQLPDEVNITHVRATIERDPHGQRLPLRAPCSPGKVLTCTQATGGA